MEAVGSRGRLVAFADSVAGSRLSLPDGHWRQTEPGLEISAVSASREGFWLAGTHRREGREPQIEVFHWPAESSDEPLPRVFSKAGQDPVLFVDHGDLAGLAWLEGTDARSFRVVAATTKDRNPEAVQVVSGRGPGSQITPRGVALDDGSWLLVWVAFDGHDSELFWSRRVGLEWSSPERVVADNGTPDITPALVGLGSTAVVAWSRYDGHDYRLRLARFEAGQWFETSFESEPGTLFPRLDVLESTSSRRTFLTYRVPGRKPYWTVSELDTAGHVLERGLVAVDSRQPPALDVTGDGGVLLEWSTAESTLRRYPVVWGLEP